MLKNRKTLFIFLVVILLGSGAITANQVIGSNRTPELESWPAFAMVYTEDGFGMAPNGKLGSQTIEVDYNAFDNWKVTITANADFPALKGTWTTYDGHTITHYNAENGEETVNDVSKDNGFHVPAQWLVPLYVPNLLKKPGVTPEPGDEPNLQKIIVTDEAPCEPFTEAQKEAGLAECRSDQKLRSSTREVIFDNEYLIPRKIVDRLDGVGMYTVTVNSVTIKQ
jgi:hypothetical protein